MTGNKDIIMNLLSQENGLTDREITDRIFGKGSPQQQTNQICRALESKGYLNRLNKDGKIKNFIAEIGYTPSNKPLFQKEVDTIMSEDLIKKYLERWLVSEGWQVRVAWGHTQGVDVLAIKDNKHWIIEAKGEGSLHPMRVNYFVAILGETLQRMHDPEAIYSIALPDMQQFQNLWQRLPTLAKQRTGISVLFIDKDGKITQQN
jgi:hypothetical protein